MLKPFTHTPTYRVTEKRTNVCSSVVVRSRVCTSESIEVGS
jgi:hypothetical protein